MILLPLAMLLEVLLFFSASPISHEPIEYCYWCWWCFILL